jgi:alanyl-tRNA synthetase
VVQESSIAAGVRRIEAITGEAAYLSIKRQEDDLDALAALLKVQPADVVERARKVLTQLRDQERELERLKGKAISGQASSAMEQSVAVNGVTLLVQRVDGVDPKALRQFADSVRDRMERGVLLVGSVQEGKVALVAMVTKSLTGQFHAGRLLQTIAPIVGGSGGGRPEMAQAGGKLADRLDEALQRGREILTGEASQLR